MGTSVLDGRLRVRRGASEAATAAEVAAELREQVWDPDAAIALVFATPQLPAAELAEAVAEQLAPVPVYGCTTAGEIGPHGIRTCSVVAMTLTSPHLRVGAGLVRGLSRSAVSGGNRAVVDAAAELGLTPGELDSERHVVMTLVDGRSGKEESFIAAAAATAPAVRFVGGSASDRMDDPPSTRIFARGEAHADSGLVLLMETDLPFSIIHTEHMIPTERRVVVTATDATGRLVHELDGYPATRVYAEILGIEEPVDSALAGRSPFGYYVGGRPYVRSVMEVEGESLRFACAVSHGSVLRPMVPGDMITTTRDALERARAAVGGSLDAVIAFNCYGRYLETEAFGNTAVMGDLLASYPLIGFNTFGEQVNALHVNHTLTGLAFGSAAAGGGDRRG